MVNIMEIDPDKKYVLLVPDMPRAALDRLNNLFSDALQQDGRPLIVISGDDITLIPADQIVDILSADKKGTEP